MRPLSETEIRAAFVNMSKREVREATVPDLERVDWAATDVLGWTDEKKPGQQYVVVEVDGEPVGFLLRAVPAEGGRRRRALCSWCEDVTATDDVALHVAARAGAAGRKGDTVGTLICCDFGCSRHVRRQPSVEEIGVGASTELKAAWVETRVEGLRERAARFARHVLAE